jgi:hypothetical protein
MASHEHHHLAIEHEKPDSWHRHSAEEGTPMAEHAAIASPGVLAKVYVLMFVVVAGTVLVLSLFFMSYITRERALWQETTVLAKDFHEMKNHAESELESYGWSDAKSGAVRIPIDVAMSRVIEKYKARSVNAEGAK